MKLYGLPSRNGICDSLVEAQSTIDAYSSEQLSHMASGFIVLRDGRCFAVRSQLHDAVLRSIARALPNEDVLREWLTRQVPSDQDHEMGHAFVRAADDVHVSRSIDTRAMAPEVRQRFEHGVRVATSTGEPNHEDLDRCLSRLQMMLGLCDQGQPPLELSDWRVLTPPPDERIGPD